MVSRRNFFSITIMMVVLFFMFQFSQAFKNQGNNFDINEYAERERPDRTGFWSGEKDSGEKDYVNPSQRGYVLYVGDETTQEAETVKEWANYAKRGFVCTETIGEFAEKEDQKDLPEMIFLGMEAFDTGKDTEIVRELSARESCTFVFCGAPDMAQMKNLPDLAKLMGLDITGDEVAHTIGYNVFSGFLLGGEVIYTEPERMEESKAEKIQDLSYDMQWYRTSVGTKTYMVGMMEDEDMEKELYPAVIWRNTCEKSQIYVVTGGFLKGAGGFGVIDGILCEASDYLIYPVINARTFSMVDYPAFSAENEERLISIYARGQMAIQRDLFWPNLMALIKQEKLKPTSFVNVQYDYTDDIWPSNQDMDFYLQQLKELDGEAGWSIKDGKGIDIRTKVSSDASFFDVIDTKYKFAAAYADRITEDLTESFGTNVRAKAISTVLTKHVEEYPYVGYLDGNVTLQTVAGGAMDYTYSMDFEIRGLLSALGYGATLLDMHSVLWPESAADQWESYYDEASSYISSFWNFYKGFERTTLSQTDYRIRNFLNLSYTDKRTGDSIRLKVTDSTDSWFVLRTHGEEIESADGAVYEKLEENVFLLNVTGDSCTIKLKGSGSNLKF